MAGPVTLSQVAREAGVSLATASRAINGSANRTVREDLRERVLETAPRPAGIEARMVMETDGLVLTAAGGPLAAGDPGLSYFFPFEGGVIEQAAPQTGAWGPQGLTLRMRPGGT